MIVLEKIALPYLNRIDPERAHRLAMKALKLGLKPMRAPFESDRLKTSIGGFKPPQPHWACSRV